ncbi:hypothetical protein BGY98DRAFT_983313, partial [Russula aff. rugulosa BPL654]
VDSQLIHHSLPLVADINARQFMNASQSQFRLTSPVSMLYLSASLPSSYHTFLFIFLLSLGQHCMVQAAVIRQLYAPFLYSIVSFTALTSSFFHSAFN